MQRETLTGMCSLPCTAISVSVVTEQAVQGKGEATEFPSPPRRLRDSSGTEAGVLWEEPQWWDECRKVLESSQIKISQKLPGNTQCAWSLCENGEDPFFLEIHGLCWVTVFCSWNANYPSVQTNAFVLRHHVFPRSWLVVFPSGGGWTLELFSSLTRALMRF